MGRVIRESKTPEIYEDVLGNADDCWQPTPFSEITTFPGYVPNALEKDKKLARLLPLMFPRAIPLDCVP